MDGYSEDGKSSDELIARIRELEARLGALRAAPDTSSLVEELRVHQIELEAQNRELIEARRALEDARDRYSDLYDFAPVGYMTLDEHGVILEINLTGARLLGQDRAQVIGMPLSGWVPNGAVAQLFHHLRRVLSEPGRVFDHLPLHTSLVRESPIRHVRLESIAFTQYGSGRLCRTALVDLSDRKREEDRLNLIAQVFERSTDAIMITDSLNRIVSVNRAFTTVTGYSADEVLGRNPKLLASGRHDRDFYREMWSAIERNGSWSGEISNRRKNGEIYNEWLTIHAVRNEAGSIENCIAIYAEITDQRAAASRIRFLAHYDPLTLLPNRALLQDRMHQGLAHAAREGTRAAVLFLDLDRFKTINDSLGHLVGDHLLQEVAKRLKASVREDDTVARRGGDEFIVMLPHVDSAEQAAHVAGKIIEAMEQTIPVNGYVLNVSFSIGISVFPDDAMDPDTLIRNADIAMYRSKASGRNQFQFFTADMNAHALERLALENDLHRAVERGEFRLMFQPQFDGSGGIIGAEALLRWQHPQRGLVTPAEFIPVAEETGLIVPIGAWVLERACQQVGAWREAGLKKITVSVNISALQFSQKNLLELIRRLLAVSNIEPGTLELELTESVLMHDHVATSGLMSELKEMGVRMAIDDFGTGYSSLSYLRSFPISKLKIDQSFVRDLSDGGDAGAITGAIIGLAKNLNMRVIAEGVETAQQASFLQAQCCDEFQGHFFSQPVSPEKFAELLRAE
ncbi:putative bifunctional diguanylate cyclase/phosphodiesterase [Aromatoleum aromaticum]|uniref:putative bifunctional diguanylate cyclase/phosphodiesterase n=1 Tax=Aromatoleum aromaticum TaxID=551760 RepID=UPI0014596C59|nr:EAL domain-containing protein [Aromatoleum aromaticum]NMG56176.1 EAL domain-containing protein [Aromatoleum aromaticum]